jgi:tRNA1(Val) A37 N6-methylase TrmN6
MRTKTVEHPEKSKPDDILNGTLKIFQPDEGAGPRVNVDTILLAHFARVPAYSRIIELGCAHGAISLILAKRRRQAKERLASTPCIDALDIDPRLIELAEKNAEINGLSEDVSFFVSDLRAHRENFPAGTYDAVIMNPPYGEPRGCRPNSNEAMARAMHGESCSLADVVASAKFLLRNGGKFFLVMRASRCAELFGLLNERNVRPKRVRAVHPKPGREASVILVEATRASSDGLTMEPPLFIYGPDGKYTEDLLDAYRTGEPDSEELRSCRL